MHKVHTWFAVSVSGFFLAWLISGIVMILPRLSAEPDRPSTLETIDIKKISQSVQEVLANLATHVGDVSQITAVTIKRIADSDVYEIVTSQRGAVLVDAQSGKPFSITAKMAEVIAKRHIGSVPQDLKIESISRHEWRYPWGPLPVYRVAIAADPSTFYYVSATDGTVNRSDRESRIRNALASLHTLDPIKLLVASEAFRKGTLILTGLVGIAAVCTGLLLALKRRP